MKERVKSLNSVVYIYIYILHYYIHIVIYYNDTCVGRIDQIIW